MTSVSKKAQKAEFDPKVGSTIDAGIDDAVVPDITKVMKEIMYVCIMTPQGDPFDPTCIWGAPVVVWGLPSTAKSDGVEQASCEASLQHATIYPGQRQPEDFSGVLVPYSTGVVIECMLGAVRKLNPIGRGVIFLDEINNASRATEGAMLGFIQKRIVADNPMAPGIRLIAAANPPKWSANGFQMTPPTANRFAHFQVKCPPVEKFAQYLICEEAKPIFDAGGTEDSIRAQWGSVYGYEKSKLIGYLQSQPHSLHHEPEPDHPQSGYNWGSPRMWRMGIRMVSAAKILGYNEEIQNLVLEGCVGEGLAFDYQTWVRQANLPTPEEVLRTGWAPDMRRLDVAYAVLISTTQYATSAPDLQEGHNRAVGMWNLLQKFIAVNMGDMTVNSAQALVAKNLSRKSGNQFVLQACDPVLGWMTDNGMLRHVA